MRPTPAGFGDVTGEYLALRGGAGLVAPGHELVWVRGPDALSFLDGLLSQDLAGIPEGGVARSLLLEPRGKLASVLWVLRGGSEELGLAADPGMGGDLAGDLARFRFRVDAELVPAGEPAVEVWGPEAEAVLEGAGLPAPEGWARAGESVVAAIPLGGLPRYLVAGVPAEDLEGHGARPVGTVAATTVRIEAGEPRMGIDVGRDTIPQESGLVEAAVSLTKGCFLGQELVARIDSRGRVNRHLRGVTVAENVIPPEGAVLHAGGGEVGTLTSVGESLVLRAPVALAMVRREVEPGDGVEIRWEGGSTTGTVRALPLDDFSSG
jgi:folate-binding protein YgfZ